jgi:AcrR family transcriptional regulator
MPRIVDHGRRRRELVEATRAVISTAGFEATTMRAVAAQAGCTTGRITHYFSDREELLLAALASAHEAAGARMLDATRATASAVARLRAVLHHALPLDARSLAEWKVWIAFWAYATTDDRLAREDRRRYREWSDLLSTAVRAVRPIGPADATVAILMAWVDGAGIRGAVHPGVATRRAIVAELDDLLERLELRDPDRRRKSDALRA